MRRPIEPGIRIGAQEHDDSEEAQLKAALREASARWASGVAAVAVGDGSSFEAITVTSYLTVSLDPPIILVSIDRQAAIVPLLDAAARFTVSILSAAQQRAASLIADRVPTVRPLFTDGADAYLKDALQALICRTEDVHPAGDHRLYIARVERVIRGPEGQPLLYYRRGYRRLKER